MKPDETAADGDGGLSVAGTDLLGGAFLAIATGVLAAGGYQRPAPKMPVAVERVWTPGKDAGCAVPARFHSRHPDLHFAFGDLPVRARGKWFKPSRRHWQGRKQSGLMQRTIETTGDLEFRGAQIIELEPDVTALFEQPVLLSYIFEGQPRRTTPDLYVERGEHKSFVEFKYEEHAALPHNEAKFNARGMALAAAGYGYSVITERHLRRQPLEGNVDRVLRSRHQRTLVGQTRSVLDHLAIRGEATMAELVEVGGISESELLFLVRHCLIGTDLHGRELGSETLFRARIRGHARVPDGRLLPEAVRKC